MLKVLESLPIITFFVLYKFFNIFVATAGIAISSIIITALTYIKTKTLSKFNVVNTVLLIFLSGLTILLKDSSFVKMKPTVIYSLVATFLIIDLMYLKKFYVQKLYLPIIQKSYGDVLIKKDIWRKITFQWIVLLLVIAFSNEITWRFIGEKEWVNFKVFVVPLILMCVFFIHINLLTKQTNT